MTQISRAARALTFLLALTLLVPTLGIAIQSQAALEEFHNRGLSKWPKAADFRSDPVGYFGGVKTWVADRVFPIEQVTHFQKTVAFVLLRSVPEPRVTLGKQGHIFLNGGNNQNLNELFDTACIAVHTQSVAATLEKALSAWAQTGLRRELAVDVVIIPTAASIYADRLPATVPEKYRRACLERTAGISPLLSVRAPAGVTFVYPLREMLDAREDDAFFPRGNWHPTGLSLKVVRDTYLARLQKTGSVDETLELGKAPAEILMPYGIRLGEPTYFIHNGNTAAQPALNTEVRKAISGFFFGDRFVTHAFTNSKPVVDQEALILSDSYGDLAAEAFAGAFRKLIHVNANDMQGGKALQVVDRVKQIEPVDRLILLVQEGNTQKIAGWQP